MREWTGGRAKATRRDSRTRWSHFRTHTYLTHVPVTHRNLQCNLRLGREYLQTVRLLARSLAPLTFTSTTMATAEPVNTPVATSAVNGTVLPPPDKYRGAVVEVAHAL